MVKALKEMKDGIYEKGIIYYQYNFRHSKKEHIGPLEKKYDYWNFKKYFRQFEEWLIGHTLKISTGIWRIERRN